MKSVLFIGSGVTDIFLFPFTRFISMTFVIVENLRTFFNSRPPLVVFMICLASFAVALITFAYIVKTKDLPNPDVTEVRFATHKNIFISFKKFSFITCGYESNMYCSQFLFILTIILSLLCQSPIFLSISCVYMCVFSYHLCTSWGTQCCPYK